MYTVIELESQFICDVFDGEFPLVSVESLLVPAHTQEIVEFS